MQRSRGPCASALPAVAAALACCLVLCLGPAACTVVLPFGAVLDDLPGAAAAQAAPLDRLMLLVVDDNPMNLRVAQKVFSLLNQEPILAQGAQEALAFLKTALFDMVFLDIEMPDINGIELCRMIRDGVTTPLNKNVYITAMTAYSLDTIRDECLACGMDDFITKPLDPQVRAGRGLGGV